MNKHEIVAKTFQPDQADFQNHAAARHGEAKVSSSERLAGVKKIRENRIGGR